MKYILQYCTHNAIVRAVHRCRQACVHMSCSCMAPWWWAASPGAWGPSAGTAHLAAVACTAELFQLSLNCLCSQGELVPKVVPVSLLWCECRSSSTAQQALPWSRLYHAKQIQPVLLVSAPVRGDCEPMWYKIKTGWTHLGHKGLFIVISIPNSVPPAQGGTPAGSWLPCRTSSECTMTYNGKSLTQNSHAASVLRN